MTEVYPCHRPEWHPCILNWSHSACVESWFVTRWYAIESAYELAWQLGLPPLVSHTPPAKKPPVCGRNRIVRFSSDVELRFVQDEPTMNATLTVSDVKFLNWADKPWSRFPSQEISFSSCIQRSAALVLTTLNPMSLVCAPLSKRDEFPAVLSSKDSECEFSSLMQNFPQPRKHNAPDEPAWYPHQAGGGIHDVASSSSEDNNAPSDHEDSDPEDHDEGGSPPDDPGIHPPDHEDGRQSVLLYHLDDIPVHTMLNWNSYDVMMREVAHHFAVDRVDLLACHDMTTLPEDMPEGTVPLIVQMARDIPVGDPSVLVMIDTHVHAQAQEPHFFTSARTRRKILAVPARLTRQALLIHTQVFEYCRFEHNRCLVQHEGGEWPLQEAAPRNLLHGNYLQITVPPPERCEVPTRDMLEDSRTMDVEAFWERYYIPTPPSVHAESGESETDVSPSLVDSDDIRREFGHFEGNANDTDAAVLMQRPPVVADIQDAPNPSNDQAAPRSDCLAVDESSNVPVSSSNQAASSSDCPPQASAGTQTVNAHQNMTDFSPLHFNPSPTSPWPLWFRALNTVFYRDAAVERDDEGPVVYLTTWYADCRSESTSEESRPLRLDSYAITWAQDIQHVWRDKIQAGVPVHFAWVMPEPANPPAVFTNGHLIVYQHPNEIFAPILLSFQFRALNLDGTALAVAVVRHGIEPSDLARLVKLDRVCGGRRCTLHRGAPGKKWFDNFNYGEGIKMSIPSPGERADPELYWSLGAVVLVFDAPLVPIHPILSMRLEDQPQFIQNLHELWVRFGSRNEMSQERFLEVTTWYLDGMAVPYNDQQRPVLLGSDFTEWMGELRRVWHDMEDANEDMEFAFVRPTPACSPLTTIHILLYQQIDSAHVGIIVTKYDNAVIQGRPFSAAAVCDNPINRASVLFAIGKSTDCTMTGVQCKVWKERNEIDTAAYAADHGTNLQVHIYRQSLHTWDSDDDEPEETMLMQSNFAFSGDLHQDGNCTPFVFNAHAAEFLPNRPAIALMPEFLQDLYVLWDRHATALTDGTRQSKVQTWFLSPGRGRLRCGYCRKVTLSEDFLQWETLMKDEWKEEISHDQPVEFFLVQPTPVALEHDISAHILLVQDDMAHQVSSLVTVSDVGVHQGHPFRLAIVTHEHITQAEVIERVGYTEDCTKYGKHIQCTLRHAALQIPSNSKAPGRDGDHLTLLVQRSHHRDPAWQPPFLPVAPGMEGLLFLQQKAAIHRRQPVHVTAKPKASIELLVDDVQKALQWFDTHFVLPCFDIEAQLQGVARWQTDSLAWVRTEWFACERRIDAVRIYYDGSYLPADHSLGFAAAAFVRISHEWFFAGALSGKDDSGSTQGSYRAEVLASTIAAKFMYDICKVEVEAFHCIPTCELVFDSLTVGKQSEGKWKAAKAIAECHLVRSIMRLCENRFGVCIKHQFCPSHQGEPGNEIADQLAHTAALGKPLQNWTPFFAEVHQTDFVQAMEWAWILFSTLPGVSAGADRLVFPAKPTTTPTVQSMPVTSMTSDISPTMNVQVCLQVATCNVLTLQSGARSEEMRQAGVTGPARQDWILDTLDEYAISVFALQETRTRTVRRHSDHRYHLIRSAATPQGHFGMMIGLSKTKPHGWLKGTPIMFADNDYRIITAQPRLLIVQIRYQALKCVIIAAHAPHTGATLDEIEEFWQDAAAQIPSRFDTWPKLLLADANCRLGGQPDGRVGTWQSEGMNDKSQPFADFLAIHNLFLPSTFEECHTGVGGTWLCQDGTWKRNDYIGIDCTLPLRHCQTWIPEEVDFSLQKEDHRPLFAKLEWEQRIEEQYCHVSHPKLQESSFDTTKLHEVATRLHRSFEMDVHTHAWSLQTQIVACSKSRKPYRHQHKPRKETISPATWDLIKHKQQWRGALADNQQIQQRTQLATFFAAWRFSRCGGIPVDMLASFDRIQVEQDTNVAVALHYFRTLGRQVTQALRKDDAEFFRQLSSEASEFMQPHQVREFWRVLRRSLPKFRDRKLGQDPHKLEILQDQWTPYFEQLESGTASDPQQIVQQCHARQMAMPIAQDSFRHDDIPSIIEFEDALRATQADRATGLDPVPSGLFRQHATQLATAYFPLLLKICMWQHEPVSSKGGQMAVIHKRGSHLQVENYRGIMLLPSIAKRVHAMLRARLMRLLATKRPQGQIGGFPAMQVPFGSQLLQTFGRIMDALNFSSAVVFIDLANAFHRLVREFVSGIHVPDDIEDVLERLLQEGLPVPEMVELLQLPSLLERLGAPPFLVQLLQDLHTHTWMCVPGASTPIVTKKGTRPGSSLADCIFHILMADIAVELNQVVEANQEFQEIMQFADLHVESVIWADDVAIPIATFHAEKLPSAIEQILVSVHRIFARRGFTLNFKKGKTSVVATFKGPGAPLMRARYQLNERPGMEVTLGDKCEFIHFMATYKHLGTIFSANHTMDQEIAARIGAAKSAFAQIASPILCNRHLPEVTRVRLFRALIESRLFFGMGAWKNPTARQFAKLQAALISMLRKLFRLKPDEILHTTAASLLHRAKICSPRARLAVDRLLYAQRVWHSSPEMLQHSLHREEALIDDSWLLGLKYDLAWLCTVEPEGSIPLQEVRSAVEPRKVELTTLIDFWQSDTAQWKACIRRAWKKFQFQETMMHELFQMHKTFFRTLEGAQASFEPSPYEPVDIITKVFECRCGRQFSTAQGLATHRRKQHQEFSYEHDLLSGTTCPECLRHFWTKQRLYQHLSYVSRKTGLSRCYQALRQRGFQFDSEVGHFNQMPAEVRGLSRVDALQAQGPLLPLPVRGQQEDEAAQSRLQLLKADLDISSMPENLDEARASLRSFLTEKTEEWFQRFCAEGFDEELVHQLPDQWLGILFQFEHGMDEWVEAEILDWGQNCLPDVLDQFADGVAERLVDDEFAEMIEDFPRIQALRQIAHLEARRANLARERDVLFPHRAPHRGSANKRERALSAAYVPGAFENQEEFFGQVGKACWFDLPVEVPMPLLRQPAGERIFVIAHLFSGRRRVGDVHDRLQYWAQKAGIRILVLSLDTANSVTFGDLHHEAVTWQNLLRLYQQGKIAATITGAPCETWSAARHFQLSPEDVKEGKFFPRPLRDRDRLFGRRHLTFRELRQLRQGSLFFMQMLTTVAWTLATGGVYLSEHPAPPQHPEAASIWFTPWLQILCRHPDIVLHTVAQWRWGCSVSKPTGLLAVRLPRFAASMYSRQVVGAQKPTDVAIGIGHDGKFKTAVHKEYPPQFCDALAGTIIDQIRSCLSHRKCTEFADDDSHLSAWLFEAAAQCGQIHAAATWLPDFQDR